MSNTKEGHGVLIKTDRKDKELLNKKMAVKNRYDEGCYDSELITKKKVSSAYKAKMHNY